MSRNIPQSLLSMRLLILAVLSFVLLVDGACHGFTHPQGGEKKIRRDSSSQRLSIGGDETTESSGSGSGSSRGSSNAKFHPSRRDVIVASMAGLTAEAAWRRAVETAAFALDDDGFGPAGGRKSMSVPVPILPEGTIEQMESGRAVVIPNWLSPKECEELRADVRLCFEGGHFKNFILSRNPNQADKAANDRWIMNSYSKATSRDGPFADPNVGNFALRQNFKARMAEVKARLSSDLHGRPTLARDDAGSHEMEYLRYGAGALLQRHTDEHHVELQRPGGAMLPKKPNATRRSVTWMVYLNDGWDGGTDGGHLRLHERASPAISRVGSRGQDLQVGWLKATVEDKERPVFLDPLRDGPPNETCMLYVVDDHDNDNDNDIHNKLRDLSSKPFANIALHLAGGDSVARKLMAENTTDAKRLHLIDAPKSIVSSSFTPFGDAGEDGGETIRDIEPKAGTLVMFDSVSLPHEVMLTNKERYGIQGWFHEELGYQV